jgi:hypothetical protein
MSYNPLNRVIEDATMRNGMHSGVAVMDIAPAIRDLVRNKIMPLYLALEGTEHFPEIEKFLESIGCAPERRVKEEPKDEDEHEKLEVGA